MCTECLAKKLTFALFSVVVFANTNISICCRNLNNTLTYYSVYAKTCYIERQEHVSNSMYCIICASVFTYAG